MEYLKVRTIYVDMDGVIADFERHYKELFGISVDLSIDNVPDAELWTNIDKHGKSRFFEELPWMPGGQELWWFINKFAKDNVMRVKILSALGKSDKVDGQTSKGKLAWLHKNIPTLKDTDIILVENKHIKRHYSKPGNIIIDDTPIVIEEWVKKGGIGILFQSSQQVIKDLNMYVYEEI